MNISPSLSDYKERFASFAKRRIRQLKRRRSLHRRLYKQDNNKEHLVIVAECTKLLEMLDSPSLDYWS